MDQIKIQNLILTSELKGNTIFTVLAITICSNKKSIYTLPKTKQQDGHWPAEPSITLESFRVLCVLHGGPVQGDDDVGVVGAAQQHGRRVVQLQQSKRFSKFLKLIFIKKSRQPN